MEICAPRVLTVSKSMCTSRHMNYDAWLERPYEDAERYERDDDNTQDDELRACGEFLAEELADDTGNDPAACTLAVSLLAQITSRSTDEQKARCAVAWYALIDTRASQVARRLRPVADREAVIAWAEEFDETRSRGRLAMRVLMDAMKAAS